MNISIDNRYCNRFIHLGRPIFSVNHSGASLYMCSRDTIWDARMHLSVLHSRSPRYPICDLSQIIATRCYYCFIHPLRLQYLYPPRNKVGYTGFNQSVCLPAVCPSVRLSRIRSVAPTVLIGSIFIKACHGISIEMLIYGRQRGMAHGTLSPNIWCDTILITKSKGSKSLDVTACWWKSFGLHDCIRNSILL